MSAEIDQHVTNQYEINKRVGKGVSYLCLTCTMNLS